LANAPASTKIHNINITSYAPAPWQKVFILSFKGFPLYVIIANMHANKNAIVIGIL